MVNVTILSAFRNACGYIERYCEQMDALQAALHARGDTLRLILGYGDSTDGTEAALFDECSHRFCAHLLELSHGGPHFGSIEHPQRFRQLAYVGNRLLDNLPKDDGTDIVGIVESDLIWSSATMLRLIDHVATYPVIAPLIMDVAPPDRFRDVYAFRRHGRRFTNGAPYHADLLALSGTNVNGAVLQVDSAGSVLFMHARWARMARFPEEDVIVGFCRQIYEQGGSVYVDPALKVFHP